MKDDLRDLGWEFIKEKKKLNKKVTTHASTKKRARSRKHARVREKQELAQEHTHSTKKASTKKELVQENR